MSAAMVTLVSALFMALLLHAWSLLPIEALDVKSRKAAKLVDADVYVCARAPNATNHVVASRMRMYAVKL